MKFRAARTDQPSLALRAEHPWQSSDQNGSTIELLPSERTELLLLGELLTVKAHSAPIFMQGERAKHLYYLDEGVVQGRHTIRNGVRQSVALFWPGDFFGLPRDGCFFNSAEAVTNCTTYKFPIKDLEKYLPRRPRIQQKLLLKASHDIRLAQRRLIVMGALDVTRRLAVFLVDCCGHAQHFDDENQVLTVPISRHDIADHIGTSAETVTRAMKTLEKKGLVRRITPWQLELKMSELFAFSGLD